MTQLIKIMCIAASIQSFSATLLAADLTVKCPVVSDTAATAAVDQDYLLIQYRTTPDRGYVDRVSYVSTTSNSDASNAVLLFGQENRGGFDAAYCNPDNHEYSIFTETFSLQSTCKGKKTQSQLSLLAKLSKKTEGSFKIVFRDLAESINLTRVITTKKCQ